MIILRPKYKPHRGDLEKVVGVVGSAPDSWGTGPVDVYASDLYGKFSFLSGNRIQYFGIRHAEETANKTRHKLLGRDPLLFEGGDRTNSILMREGGDFFAFFLN